jgi:transcriptional regulator GlxA family with amidase domain
MDAVRHLRLQRARYLVMTTALPLADIAARVGIANPFHLSRLFRRYFGKSPREFRR